MYSQVTNTRVTLKVAAELLNKDVRTVQSAYDRKEIAGYKAAKKGVMLQKSSVLRYAKEKGIKLSPKAAADLQVTRSERKSAKARKARKAPPQSRKPKAKEAEKSSAVIGATPLPAFENPVPA